MKPEISEDSAQVWSRNLAGPPTGAGAAADFCRHNAKKGTLLFSHHELIKEAFRSTPCSVLEVCAVSRLSASD